MIHGFANSIRPCTVNRDQIPLQHSLDAACRHALECRPLFDHIAATVDHRREHRVCFNANRLIIINA
jgi:hypothetical protein